MIVQFLSNKYAQKYGQIVARGKLRGKATARRRQFFKPTVYIIHHIVPRSLGGDNSYDNLVLLTPKEHFICHRLLTKITTGKNKQKMISALYFMSNSSGYECSAKLHERLYLEYSSLLSVSMSGVNNPHYGKTHSEEAKERIGIGHRGRKYVLSTNDNRGRRGIKRPETGPQISKSSLGKPKTGKAAKGHNKSEETKRRMSLAVKKYWASRTEEVLERKRIQGALFSKLRKSGHVRTWNKKTA